MVSENIHTLLNEEGLLEMTDSMKLNWNFQRGGFLLKNLLQGGGVWIFCGTTRLEEVSADGRSEFVCVWDLDQCPERCQQMKGVI